MRKIRVLDNVYDLITINMEDRFKDNVAFRFYDTANDAVTTTLYKDYVQDIRKAVNYFQSTIPEIKGKKICLLTKNSYEYAVNTFGVVAAGAVLVLLNQRKSWDELSYELGLVEPDAILTDGDDYGFNDQLKAAYGDILRPMDGFRSYEPAQLTRCIDHEALMVLMFTSGTTGRSKGVMLSEKNFFSVMRAHTQIGEHMMAYKHEPNLVMSQYTVLPMFHLGAFICLFSWAHAGWALNVSSDIRNFYKEVKRMPSQAMAVVPVIMNSLHHDVMRGRKERLGELWVPICSSAMFDPQVMLDMAEHGMFVVQTYGSTETCGDGIINYAQDAKHIGAVGQGNDYLDYKIAEDGELCMRGDSIMLGYYKDPEATAEVIDADGWFHTGDLARKDEDGYYFLTGRKKNLIILDSGENISPEELEGIVGKCEAVKECVVKEMGKKIGVVPILRAGLGMLDGMLDLIPTAPVAHLGMYRDEVTHEPHEYYAKMPDFIAERSVLLVDPMLATGGSLCAAIDALRKRGVKDISACVIVASPEGVQTVLEHDSSVRLFTCAIDEGLNEDAYIVPGLGDAGDRIFGTK